MCYPAQHFLVEIHLGCQMSQWGSEWPWTVVDKGRPMCSYRMNLWLIRWHKVSQISPWGNLESSWLQDSTCSLPSSAEASSSQTIMLFRRTQHVWDRLAGTTHILCELAGEEKLCSASVPYHPPSCLKVLGLHTDMYKYTHIHTYIGIYDCLVFPCLLILSCLLLLERETPVQ